MRESGRELRLRNSETDPSEVELYWAVNKQDNSARFLKDPKSTRSKSLRFRNSKDYHSPHNPRFEERVALRFKDKDFYLENERTQVGEDRTSFFVGQRSHAENMRSR